MKIICLVSDYYEHIYTFMTQILRIDLLDIYIWIRIQQKYIQSIYTSVYNWFYDVFFTPKPEGQIISSIQYIENIEDKKNIIDIMSHLNKEYITLMDIHRAIMKEKELHSICMINGHVEIIYSLNYQEYVFTFPIYISDIEAYLDVEQHLSDIKIFPIDHISELNVDYEFAEFKLREKKSRQVSEHNLPELLKKYSGPNNDFYFNYEITTLDNNFNFIQHKYQLHKNMINLELHPNINCEHDIISICALRSDNADIDIDSSNFIIKCS